MLPQLSTSLNKHPCVCRRKLSWRTRGINRVYRHTKQQIGDGGLLNHTCKGRADTLIVKTAMDCAKLANPVLVGDDMYLLVLLCYHADMHSKYLFFPPKPKANCTKFRVWDIKKTTNDCLGSNVCLVILFIHAILVVTLRQC